MLVFCHLHHPHNVSDSEYLLFCHSVLFTWLSSFHTKEHKVHRIRKMFQHSAEKFLSYINISCLQNNREFINHIIRGKKQCWPWQGRADVCTFLLVLRAGEILFGGDILSSSHFLIHSFTHSVAHSVTIKSNLLLFYPFPFFILPIIAICPIHSIIHSYPILSYAIILHATIS